MVHALDGSGAAKELARRHAPGASPVDVLLEVNVTGESTKHGVPPQELQELLDVVSALPELRAVGLMTLPPADDPEAAQRAFETLASLRNLHGGAAALPELSMGMSDDLELAIAAGSTYVRAGTAIFGERPRRA